MGRKKLISFLPILPSVRSFLTLFILTYLTNKLKWQNKAYIRSRIKATDLIIGFVLVRYSGISCRQASLRWWLASSLLIRVKSLYCAPTVLQRPAFLGVCRLEYDFCHGLRGHAVLFIVLHHGHSAVEGFIYMASRREIFSLRR